MKSKIEIDMTKEEFHQLLINCFVRRDPSKQHLLAKDAVTSFYYWHDDNHVEISITSETVEVTGGDNHTDLVVEEPRPPLYTPDPPFIHTTATNEERPWKDIAGDYWPPLNDALPFTKTKDCKCGIYRVNDNYGWVNGGQLHTVNSCEGYEEPAPVDATAALSASSTGEHGTVEDDYIPF